MRLNGCCCEACMDAPRLLRPAKTAGVSGRMMASNMLRYQRLPACDRPCGCCR